MNPLGGVLLSLGRVIGIPGRGYWYPWQGVLVSLGSIFKKFPNRKDIRSGPGHCWVIARSLPGQAVSRRVDAMSVRVGSEGLNFFPVADVLRDPRTPSN